MRDRPSEEATASAAGLSVALGSLTEASTGAALSSPGAPEEIKLVSEVVVSSKSSSHTSSRSDLLLNFLIRHYDICTLNNEAERKKDVKSEDGNSILRSY